MGKGIRTRTVEKSIKAIDKGAIAAEHVRKAYVRTKDGACQMRKEQQKQDQDQGYTESQYAEDKLRASAGMAVRQSVRSAGKIVSLSSAGLKDKGRQFEESIKGKRNREQAKQEMLRQVQRRRKAENAERIGGFPKRLMHSAGSVAGEEGDVGSARRRDGQAIFKQGNFIKTSNQQSVRRPVRTVQTAQDVAKKTYVRSKISKNLSEKTLQNTLLNPEITAKAAEYKIKAGMKTGASAARAVIASTKSLFTAIAAGGSVTAFLLIFVILFGGILYTVGGGNSSAVSPVSEEVERYEPLIRKYANQYGIGEYVELIKAVMMQESGGRGLDPMQSSEGAFNRRYPRQPNGIKDPDYSIECGVRS